MTEDGRRTEPPTEPCPCSFFEDNGLGKEICKCGDMMDEHAEPGPGSWGSYGPCAVGHQPDCPLDHGTTPCPEPIARFEERIAEAMLNMGARSVILPGPMSSTLSDL